MGHRAIYIQIHGQEKKQQFLGKIMERAKMTAHGAHSKVHS